MIKIEHVTIHSDLSGALPRLKDIHCTMEQGTLTLLIGHTGSGKTTLLNALSGLLPLDKGTIHYGEKPLWKGKRVNKEVMFDMGIVFQYPERQLFAENILKEFKYSLHPLRLPKAEVITRTNEALRQVNLPEGILEESALTLSDGLKRRVAIATTLATKPDWLFLDEPTAGVDPKGLVTLTDSIIHYKQNTAGGVVVASRDLDTFLPIADRVLILNRGRIEASMTPRELSENPEILLRANIGLPTAFQISEALYRHGIVLPSQTLSPKETAEAIIRQISKNPDDLPKLVQKTPDSNPAVSNSKEALHLSDFNNGSEAFIAKPDSHWLESLNSLTKWLFYILSSIGILLQNDWKGLFFAACLTLFCIFISGTSLRTIVRPAKPFLFFMLISGLISGVELSFQPETFKPDEIHFSLLAAANTIKQLTGFLLVMLLGILFSVTTNSQAMQRGLEHAFSFLYRFRIPVSVFAFSASLILRFLPMLYKEMERMSLIVRARGKSRVKSGSLRLRDAHVFLIPLILSMLKQAEDLAFALEARGYKMRNSALPSNGDVQFHRPDYTVMAIGILLLAAFIIIHLYI